MKKLSFVCSENRLRSPTAVAVFSEYENVEAIGAGTNADAATPVSGDLIEWAEIILVMEKVHKTKISQKFKPLLKGKRLVVVSHSRCLRTYAARTASFTQSQSDKDLAACDCEKFAAKVSPAQLPTLLFKNGLRLI